MIGTDVDHFPLRETVRGVLSLLAYEAAAKGIVLTFEAEPDVPDRLAGDIDPLCRALSLLVSNALTWSDHGSVSIHVGEAFREEQRLWLHFSVADNGPGIDPARAAILFERQEHDRPERGLLAVRRLVEEMGGEVWVESMPGQGSLFQFTASFPVAETSPVNAPSRPLRVLLVDDVEINQELARVAIERQGHLVTVAPNGAEAVAAFNSGAFDIIFMDIQMPVLDGYQAAALIREAEKRRGSGRIPIVAMTAYASSECRQKSFQAGMDDFISKPVRPDEITGAIARLCGAAPSAAATAAPESLPVAPDRTPVFDRDELLERLCGKAEMIARFTSMFVNSVNAALEHLEPAVAAADGDAVHRYAHTIKGAAANIGASRMRMRAAELDEAAKEGDLGSSAQLLDLLVAEFERFKQEAVGAENAESGSI